MKTASQCARVGCVLLVIALAACTTAYQPLGATGGYQERSVGKDRWFVEFFGNGHTMRDTVMVYWLQRCAEVTILNGFDYFVLVARTPPAGASKEDASEVVHAKGGGYVPIYIPSTGASQRWSARGVIELHKGAPQFEQLPHFVATKLLETLRPVVRQAAESGGNVKLPPSVVAALGGESDAGTPQGRTEGVKLDDLDALLPKQP
jgi:hypothetical protein